MGFKLQFFVGSLLALGGYFIFSSHFSTPEKVEVDEKSWFGPGQPRKDDETIRPFKISVPDEVLNDLKNRLQSARISHEPLEDSNNFYYGFNSRYLKVHFIHQKPPSSYKKTYPLLIVHGWPGNVYEFYKIIPLLTDPKKYGISSEIAFEVVAPSIPGYGWSESPHKTGYSQIEAANTFQRLMTRLRFNKYYLQGGDWGSIITVNMARLWPEKVLGLHLNMVPIMPFATFKCAFIHFMGSIFPSLFFSSPNVGPDHNAIEIFKRFTIETGYMHLQATRPDTVGTSLNDSPIGLAAYILEKFSVWTNLKENRDFPDGALTKKFTMDELLTIIMVYWVNGNIVNSQRFYREYFLDTRHMQLDSHYITIPVGHASGLNELFDRNPVELSRCQLNVTHYNEYYFGHFAAFEEPKILAQDVLDFVETLQ
ncbi:hypothetical protein WR25_05412 [Diploscapter pachys]|uniref:Epoxide hydrolase n=1 Tax=Diploscapter pachys TaxID=2018661 RepID=A0A2A2KAA1_9BILA|nr:hypothetical protein WR25_05412 [Diploscapter pachys]